MDREVLRNRAEELTAQLTLDEKLGMIHGVQLFQTKGVERLGIPPLVMSDGPMGVRQEFYPDSWQSVGLSEDFVTYLPCNSALAATWNRTLAYELGSVLGEEARGRGKDVILAPGINIKRSPLCGRNFEYFSEDPYLTGELAATFIQGVQLWDVAACVKHFAVNNQETQRLWVDVEVDEETLREIYLPAFYDAVKKGDSYTVMGAYNLLYGEHCCQSEFLLNRILRQEWGYDGVVISDWGAVHDTMRAANSQLDIEMSVTNDFDQYFMADPLKQKILSGEVSEKKVDEKVCRILMLMMKLHMLDGERKAGTYNTAGHRKKTLEAAREAVVLLKNEKNRLPLCPKKCRKILLIGENAERIHSCGGGSAEIKALYEISPLLGIRMLLGGSAQTDYVQGYCSEEKGVQDASWQEKSLENGGGQTGGQEENPVLREKRRELREEALRMAGMKKAAAWEYDTVIFIGGLNHDYDSEGIDRRDMRLPYGQDILISKLLKARPDLVVVLVGGSPVEMGAWIDSCDAVLWSWYNGMEGGTALAEILFGITNPSGKLPESFYRTHTDCSAHALGEFPGKMKVRYLEKQYVGYRYLKKYGIQPQFCFGHGLSYTTFAYRALEVDRAERTLSCIVKNTGSIAGKEIVQLYACRKSGADAGIPALHGFEKAELLPGEEKRLTLRLWEEKPQQWSYLVGASLDDIRLQEDEQTE